MAFNAWHSIKYGDENGEAVNGIIEISKGSRAKYEICKDTGILTLDRVLYSSVYYPANYGFIPQTFCDDNDPLDILIISQIDILPMTQVEAKIIGVMKMIDQGEADDKIIAVATQDMSVAHYNDISELPEYFLKEIRQFFLEYKALENKEVDVQNILGAEEGKKIYKQSIIDYREKILPTLNK